MLHITIPDHAVIWGLGGLTLQYLGGYGGGGEVLGEGAVEDRDSEGSGGGQPAGRENNQQKLCINNR